MQKVRKIMLTAFWSICPENKITIFATQLLKKTNMNILRNIMTGALLLTAPAIMRAQTDGTRTEIDPLVISADDSTALAADIPLADGAVTSLRPLSGIRATDMFLPVCDLSAPGFSGLSPWNCGFYGSDWRLHQGFNAQLSMSLTAGFGKGRHMGWDSVKTRLLPTPFPCQSVFQPPWECMPTTWTGEDITRQTAAWLRP